MVANKGSATVLLISKISKGEQKSQSGENFKAKIFIYLFTTPSEILALIATPTSSSFP